MCLIISDVSLWKSPLSHISIAISLFLCNHLENVIISLSLYENILLGVEFYIDKFFSFVCLFVLLSAPRICYFIACHCFYGKSTKILMNVIDFFVCLFFVFEY